MFCEIRIQNLAWAQRSPSQKERIEAFPSVRGYTMSGRSVQGCTKPDNARALALRSPGTAPLRVIWRTSNHRPLPDKMPAAAGALVGPGGQASRTCASEREVVVGYPAPRAASVMAPLEAEETRAAYFAITPVE